jgi:hypothetical protein
MMDQLPLFPEFETAAPAKPKRETEAQMIERLVQETIKLCEAEGVDPRALLLELKFREIKEFLEHYDRKKRGWFAARLAQWALKDSSQSKI